MIWYLLYPFRGTTEPPRLAPNHPIRKYFQHHGKQVAKNWLPLIVASIVIAGTFCYPVVFSYESPAAGSPNLPHHVWSSARPFEGNPSIRPDVEMRQVWVHGSYMRALERPVLREALSIQEALIGDGFGEKPEAGPGDSPSSPGEPEEVDLATPACAVQAPRNVSWGFHSPLMYWNCSAQAIEGDDDILRTINGQVHRRSFLNFTLRPTSVFAGKSFARNQIVAADALVITLFDRLGFGVGKQWDERSGRLARERSDQWSFYPHDGRTARSQLYEFRFQPASFGDDLLLALAYCAMAIYIVVSLRKLRAVKSKFGLGVTVLIQIAVSILGSFFICTAARINLTQIPREAYPFVVLVIGLENMFRLVNAVLANPPEMPTVHRIANALGDVGHLSLAVAAQNLLLLYLLSRFVSSGVAAFCAYAAVALVFDFVLHLTFFLAVLSVDVRRMELQDSLDRISLAEGGELTPRQERHTWGDALLQGKLPFSTRIAGSAVTICFVLVLNWHFFDQEGQSWSLLQYIRFLRSSSRKAGIPDAVAPPPPINRARTPLDWLRMQDHYTAEEVVRFVNPNSHSFIARVYDPITVVMKDAIREHDPDLATLAQFVLSIVDEHFFPILLLVFTIAVVTIFLNYLLWNELPENEHSPRNLYEPVLSIKTLPKPHTLDVVKLAACGKGHVVSIGVDRSVEIWLFEPQIGDYTYSALMPAAMTPPLWPLAALAIDDSGSWLAFCTDSGMVAFWNLAEHRFTGFAQIHLRGHLPVNFSFGYMTPAEPANLSLIVVTPDGALTQVQLSSATVQTHRICRSPILSSSIMCCYKVTPSVISVSRNGEVHASVLNSENVWTSVVLDSLRPHLSQEGKLSKVRCITAVASLGLFVTVRSCEVDLVDLRTRKVIHTLQTGQIKQHTLRVLHSPRRNCVCNAPAVHSLTLVYTELESHNCIMHTFTLDDTPSSQICMHTASEELRACHGLDSSTEAVYWVEQPGAWEATSIQAVIGLRKRPATPAPSSSSTSSDTGYIPPDGKAFKSLKHRVRDGRTLYSLRAATSRTAAVSSSLVDSNAWEAWTLSTSGELYICPHLARRPEGEREDAEQLFVAHVGPISRLGKRSVVVGFGNQVKVISLGSERFEEDGGEYQDPALAAVNYRRRGMARKAL